MGSIRFRPYDTEKGGWSPVSFKTLERKKGRVVLCCLNGYVGEIFEVNHFKDIITITDSVESGFKAFACELKAA